LFEIIWFGFSVFWDLYSAAPERRDQHPHSEEAKAFHDYVREIVIISNNERNI
jgi:hypothetical protein